MKKTNFIEEKEFELQWKESTPFHLPSQMIEDGEFIRPKYEPQHPLELEVKKYIKDKSEIQKGDVLMGLCEEDIRAMELVQHETTFLNCFNFFNISVIRMKRDTFDTLKSGLKRYIEFTEKDFSDFKDYSIENQTKIEEISANNLHRSWISIPHVTHQEEADVTNLKANLKKNGISLLALLVEASAKALKEYRKFNSSLVDKNQILYKKEVNIGIAVDTPNGLVVPVIKNADQLDSKEITQSISILAEKSRNKKLLVDDMKSATFTISSLGKIGGTGFTPIINPPEVAILGVSRTKTSLFLENSNVIEKEIMPFSLSYDHRVINGVDAGNFMHFIKTTIEKGI